ncbi:MAG TPA: NPCBM/NEW2 domain-containing protein [Candidatus Limnocylindrales bacterium]|nr:NPCBM/NEW2 domain-containing protein [Candidatus Limnocylindrales bacterium]
MRKSALVILAVLALGVTAVAFWSPWEGTRTANLTELASSDIRGYRVQAHDLVQEPTSTGGSISYALSGHFTTFETSVSLRGGPAGSAVQVQIKLDGSVEYEAELVTEQPPRLVKLTVIGVHRITLSGGAQSSLDTTLIWAEPRVS